MIRRPLDLRCIDDLAGLVLLQNKIPLVCKIIDVILTYMCLDGNRRALVTVNQFRHLRRLLVDLKNMRCPQRPNFITVKSGRVLIVKILDRGSPDLEIVLIRIFRVHTVVAVSVDEEQPSVRADRPGVAVCHIYQIVIAIQIYHIPHMGTGSGPAGHRTRDKVGRGIGKPHVTQILERLRITLADDVRGVVPVKHVDQLPGIAVGHVRIVDRLIIVGGQGTDFVPIGRHLLLIRKAGIEGSDRLRIRGRSLCRSNLLRIDRHVLIFRIAAVLIILRHIEREGQLPKRNRI